MLNKVITNHTVPVYVVYNMEYFHSQIVRDKIK